MNEYELQILKSVKDGEKSAESIAKEKGLNMDGVYSALEQLADIGAIKIRIDETVSYNITEKGKDCLTAFPEEKVLEKASKNADINQLEGIEKSVGMGIAIKKGLIKISNAKLCLTDKGRDVLERGYELKNALHNKLANDELIKRGLLSKKILKRKYISITEKGLRLLAQEKEGRNIDIIDKLTREDILKERWKNASFKKYNISAPGEEAVYGSMHILKRFMSKIREIFIQMGFEEMEGGLVESAFWNFDALFQPQDHPARELADTFYLGHPSRIKIDDKKLIGKIRRIHEKRWGGKWKLKDAEKAVLRTHTTAVSARKLYSMEIPQGKFFSIGRVFRNEAIDYKHLAEFHQVEGILAWDKANFRNLLWVLKEFYKRLGFRKIMFKPSYFPYTEPSLEIHAYFKEKDVWVELGGAGIFRKEVCKPLFNHYPVLAWGLSLERPLMIMLGIDDIRAFYKNDIRMLSKINEGALEWLL